MMIIIMIIMIILAMIMHIIIIAILTMTIIHIITMIIMVMIILTIMIITILLIILILLLLGLGLALCLNTKLYIMLLYIIYYRVSITYLLISCYVIEGDGQRPLEEGEDSVQEDAAEERPLHNDDTVHIMIIRFIIMITCQ